MLLLGVDQAARQEFLQVSGMLFSFLEFCSLSSGSDRLVLYFMGIYFVFRVIYLGLCPIPSTLQN